MSEKIISTTIENHTEVWKKKKDISREKGYYMNNYDLFDMQHTDQEESTIDFIKAFENINNNISDTSTAKIFKKAEWIYFQCQNKNFIEIKEILNGSKSLLLKCSEILQRKNI